MEMRPRRRSPGVAGATVTAGEPVKTERPPVPGPVLYASRCRFVLAVVGRRLLVGLAYTGGPSGACSSTVASAVSGARAELRWWRPEARGGLAALERLANGETSDR
jgi:hypothetical protein